MQFSNFLARKKNQYGRQRMWGTLGYGVAAVVVGIVVQKFNDMKLYFYVFGVLTAMTFCAFFTIKLSSKTDGKPSFFASFGTMMRSRELLVFYFLLLIIGMSQGLTTSFVFVFLRSLGAPPILLGISVGINSLSELIFFFFAGGILQLLKPARLLYISVFAHMIRYTAYIILGIYGNPWYVFFIDPIHCLTFACMWTAAVSYVQSVSPPGLGATAQGIMGGVFSGLGVGLGIFSAGMLYAHFGSTTMFISFIICLAFGLLVFSISQLFRPSMSVTSEKQYVIAAGKYSGLIQQISEEEVRGLLINEPLNPESVLEAEKYTLARPPSLDNNM
jgi:hypothetical protein